MLIIIKLSTIPTSVITVIIEINVEAINDLVLENQQAILSEAASDTKPWLRRYWYILVLSSIFLLEVYLNLKTFELTETSFHHDLFQLVLLATLFPALFQLARSFTNRLKHNFEPLSFLGLLIVILLLLFFLNFILSFT